MEQHRDEHIQCADCGASFIFSAAEAAVFAERALAAPRRCKDCRRLRKERAASEAQAGGRRPGFSPNAAPPAMHPSARPQAGRYGAPPPRRYTGDVNEYRSPMADSFTASPHGMNARGGEYRTPMTEGPRPPRVGRPRLTGFPTPQARTSHGNAAVVATPPSAKSERRRPQAEMSAITCDSCGAQAEVPFKPAEGREVFCPTCYRARRPAP